MADGMMGFDPLELQRFAIQQERDKQLMNEAKLTNAEYTSYQMAKAGQGLGQALFGNQVQDPRLKQAAAVQDIQKQALAASGGDASSPAFYRALATGYANAGLYGESAKAAEMAKDLITKSQSVDPVKQAQEVRRAELIKQFGPVEGNKRFIDEVNAAKVAQSAATAGSSEAEKQAAKTNQDQIVSRGFTAVQTEDTVNQMEPLLNNAFTGVGADEKLAFGRLAGALGINIAGVPESEQLDMIFKSLALGQAGNLKGALSDKDLAILRETVGTRGLTKGSLQLAFRRMRREALIDQNLANAYNEHVGQGKTASSFNAIAERKKAQAVADKAIDDREAKMKRLRELSARRAATNPAAAQPAPMGVTPVPTRAPQVNEIPGMNIAP